MPGCRVSLRTRTLRIAGTVAVVAGAQQVVGGSRAVAGVRDRSALTREPSVDSELRFYGVWYAVSGVVMHKSAADPEADRALHPLLAVGWCAAAVSRLLSARAVGRPHPLFMTLGVAEATLAAIRFRSRDRR
jgi:hypothetical protein